jgi:ankyrin repeat protein
MGTIEQGKTADLVLLDANPLKNIMNTQKIAAVVVGGKFFDKTKLQNMLTQVEVQAAILHQAVVDGDIEQVKLIISKNPDLNAGNEKGEIPLNLAAREGHKEIVELLLEHGAVNVGNAINKRIAAEFAMDNNHTEIAQLLISKGADISPLHFAIYMEDEIKARSLIEGGADVNSRTPGGITPLNQAAGKGVKDMVELLIAYDADVNAGGYWGWTPLHGAAINGYEDIAELLIAEGADVNAKTGGDMTPLWYAARHGHREIAELLIGKSQNCFWHTMLMWILGTYTAGLLCGTRKGRAIPKSPNC